jgi:hypothetical protein
MPGIGVGGEISRRPAAAAGLAIRTGTTGWTGILGQPVHGIEHLTKALGIVEETGRLADRLLLVDDPGGGPK